MSKHTILTIKERLLNKVLNHESTITESDINLMCKVRGLKESANLSKSTYNESFNSLKDQCEEFIKYCNVNVKFPWQT